ncbi:T9SS type B sorting domain-containing protein [Apibacter sp. HY039]|uniref:T9SS type B sorting domain-containing protein n=1 Tax=Apibacter sp. HY039 TaxID=2501476 RepID=UPI000FEBF0C0|nr:T9SS type B sorting domain-containing protein [Apibacter sp. HY039]
MNQRYLSPVFTLFLIIFITCATFAQSTKDPVIQIVDHNSNPNPVISCDYKFNSPTKKCLTLTVNYPEIKKTSDYIVKSIEYLPVGNFSDGADVSIKKEDDYWSSLIELPFSFCLYGKNFNSLILNDNGSISFNTPDYANQGAPYNLPIANDEVSSVLNEGKLLSYSIYGLFHDLILDPNSLECISTGGCGNITTYTTGTAPYRKFVINYNNMNHYECTSNIKSTFQIVLYETTNIIDVYVKQKPNSCKKTKFEKRPNVALIAITDGSGNGIAPANRNDITEWNTDSSGPEAWRFEPQGIITPEITWYNADNEPIAYNNQSVEVCPTLDTTYKVEVNYNSCGVEKLTTSIPIKFNTEFPSAKSIEKYTCFNYGIPITVDYKLLANEATLGNLEKYNYYFYNSYEQAIKNLPADRVSSVYTLNTYDSKLIYLRVENKDNPSCNTIVDLVYYFKEKPDLTGEQSFHICAKKGKETVIKDIIANGLIDFRTRNAEWWSLYFYTLEDAQNYKEGGNIKPIDVLKLPPPTSSTKVYVRIINHWVPDCSVLILPVNLLVHEEIELTELPPYISCDPFSFDDDLTKHIINDFPDYQKYSFTYYKSNNDAEDQINPISENTSVYPNVTKYPVNNGTTIYIRVNNYGNEYCPPIIKLSYQLKIGSIKDIEFKVCDTENKGKVEVNLESYFNQAKGSIKVSNVKYYDYFGEISYDKIKNYDMYDTAYIKVSYTEDGCDFSMSIFIEYQKYIPKMTSYPVCDLTHSGKEKFTLKTLDYTFILGYPLNSKIFYYANEKDLGTGKNTIKEMDVIANQDNFVYIEVLVWESCHFYYKLPLKLVQQVFANTNNYKAKICDNNLDDKEILDLTIYKNNVIETTDLNSYSFSYYLTYNDAHSSSNAIVLPTKYLVQNLSSSVIYIRIDDKNSTCFSIVELTFENINFIQAENASEYYCDIKGNGYKDEINIISLVNEKMIPDTPYTLKISFHDNEEDANNHSETSITKDPEKYYFNNEAHIWVRFQKESCYIIKKLSLYMEKTPKPRPAFYTVCDEKFDGVYILNSKDVETINAMIIRENTDQYTFNYYQDNAGTILIDPLTTVLTSLPNSNHVLYAKASKNGCESLITSITISTVSQVPLVSISEPAQQCDDNFDGIASFNLSEYVKQLHDPSQPLPENPQYSIYSSYDDARNQNNPKSLTNYTNIKPNEDEAYVRVSSTSHCPSIMKINLVVLPLPVSSLAKEYKICPNESLVINADTGNTEDYYKWSTGEEGTNLTKITINVAGNYSVTISNSNGCSFTYTTSVTNYETVNIKSTDAGNDYISVNAEGPAPLEYSIDKINWQDSNVFNNLEPAVYTIYVRSKNTPCNPASTKAVIFKIPNLITPNNDGYNDSWTMCGLDLFNGEKSSIKIFDRYGKVIFEENSDTCFVWNGYYLGRPLPTNSYWYLINIPDGRKFTGWILLKNYNSLQMK